jgi:hypothetical protein
LLRTLRNYLHANDIANSFLYIILYFLLQPKARTKMVASTTRVWKLDETNLFKAVLFLFLLQYAFGLGVFLLVKLGVPPALNEDEHHQPAGSSVDHYYDGFFLGLNGAVFGILLLLLRLQEKQYELDEAEEVLRVINFLPIRWFAVSATYPLAQLSDVSQVQPLLTPQPFHQDGGS